jgi:hypothetical protein
VCVSRRVGKANTQRFAREQLRCVIHACLGWCTFERLRSWREDVSNSSLGRLDLAVGWGGRWHYAAT